MDCDATPPNRNRIDLESDSISVLIEERKCHRPSIPVPFRFHPDPVEIYSVDSASNESVSLIFRLSSFRTYFDSSPVLLRPHFGSNDPHCESMSNSVLLRELRL